MVSDLSPWAKSQVIVDLQRQTIVTGRFDVSAHEAKRKLVDQQNLTVEDRDRKHLGVDNTVIVVGGFDVSTHETKHKLIDQQNLTVEVRDRNHLGLSNIKSLHGMTKHKAKALNDETVTVNDKTLTTCAMDKVKRLKLRGKLTIQVRT